MRAMKLRFFLLKLWNKLDPVPEPPPERKVIYALENTCFNHSRPITLEQTAPGVWICPECRRHAYVQQIGTQHLPTAHSPLRTSNLSKMLHDAVPETIVMRHDSQPAQEDAWLSDDDATVKRKAV